MNENANLNSTEAATPVELTAGEMLRNARTTGRRKREIQTISKQLCIREEFLQALEDGDYAAIPEQVYILGFARNYAMELGLDPDEVVAKIKREMGIVSNTAPAEATDGASSRGASGTMSWAGLLTRVGTFVRRQWRWIAVAGMVLVVLVILVVGLFGGRDAAEMGASEDGSIAVVATMPEPKFAKSVRERFGPENRASARIVLQAIHESWVKIEDARGSTVFSRVLVPGDVYYVPNGNNYKATFGNAGGIDIWVDGKSVDKVGAPHTRKSGVEMNADALLKGAGSAKQFDEEQKDDAEVAPDAE